MAGQSHHRYAGRWGLRLTLVIGLTPLSLARAHSFAPALLDLREEATGIFAVHWQPPSVSMEAPADAGELTPQLPEPCRRLPSASAAAVDANGPRSWKVDCGHDRLRGAVLTVAGAGAAPLDVLIRITWRDGRAVSGVLYRGAPQFAVPPAPLSSSDSDASIEVLAGSYLRLGIEHILRGFDHLLFVLGLLLLVPDWRTLINTLTAFTLAHSLTLALAVLDVVSVPTAPVEALIAVSIILIAVELTRTPDAPPSLTRQCPWLVAFLFGLLHGLGFAGALAALGLPATHMPLALLAFNVGVEVGQLIFVLLMALPVAAWRRMALRTRVVQLMPAYMIGALAVAWAIERIEHFWT